jgi:hypothetical protein
MRDGPKWDDFRHGRGMVGTQGPEPVSPRRFLGGFPNTHGRWQARVAARSLITRWFAGTILAQAIVEPRLRRRSGGSTDPATLPATTGRSDGGTQPHPPFVGIVP